MPSNGAVALAVHRLQHPYRKFMLFCFEWQVVVSQNNSIN